MGNPLELEEPSHDELQAKDSQHPKNHRYGSVWMDGSDFACERRCRIGIRLIREDTPYGRIAKSALRWEYSPFSDLCGQMMYRGLSFGTNHDIRGF
jgi:hypothetical protein